MRLKFAAFFLLAFQAGFSLRAATYTVTTSIAAITPGDALCGLNEALRNAIQGGDVSGGDCPAGTGTGVVLINIPDGNYDLLFNLTLTAGLELTLDGGASTLLNGATSTADRPFTLESSSSLVLKDLILANSSSPGEGGTIRADYARLGMENVTVAGSSSGSHGGAIWGQATQISLTNTSINANNSGSSGGGIYAYQGSLNLMGANIGGNSAASGGGGIIAYGCLVNISDTVVSGNSTAAPYQGGGISSQGSALDIRATAFLSNLAGTATGGGVFLSSAGVAGFTDCVFAGNQAQGGGAIQSLGVPVSVLRASFRSNSATAMGGAVQVITASFTAADSVFYGNFAGIRGGALSFNGGSCFLDNSTFAHNTATAEGGAIYLPGSLGGDLTLRHVTLAENWANAGRGGGILRENGGSMATVRVRNSVIALNHATSGEYDFDGAAEDLYGSLIGRNDGGFSFVTDGGNNITGTAGSPVDPLLDPLGDNGGNTFSMLPQVSSPLQSLADPAYCFYLDQRSYYRDAACDCGSIERSGVFGTPTATPSFTATETATPTATITATFTASETATISPTASESPTPTISATVTATPAFARSPLDRAVIGPNPSRNGQPLCLYFESAPASSSWTLYNGAGELASKAEFGGEPSHCLSVGALASGVYFARVSVVYADGSAKAFIQKVAIIK